ncbi:LOW QUALITY PROTEIN: hypothetical protein HID58_087629, partial [Brassica napus]
RKLLRRAFYPLDEDIFELSSKKFFSDTNAFVSFGDRFLDSSRVTCIQKLKLTLCNNANTVDDTFYSTSWIGAAIKRKIQHLDIYKAGYGFFTHSRLRLHSCETLVYLRLFMVFLDDAVCVAYLTMYLEENWHHGDAHLKETYLILPVKLSHLIYIDTQVYRVHSWSLESLNIEITPKVFYRTVAGILAKKKIVLLLELLSMLLYKTLDLISEQMYHREVAFVIFSRGFLGSNSRRYDNISKQNHCLNLNTYVLPVRFSTRYQFDMEQNGYNDYSEPPSVEENQYVPKCFRSSLEFVDIKLHEVGKLLP